MAEGGSLRYSRRSAVSALEGFDLVRSLGVSIPMYKVDGKHGRRAVLILNVLTTFDPS